MEGELTNFAGASTSALDEFLVHRRSMALNLRAWLLMTFFTRNEQRLVEERN
jgi:hypothetical protein